MQDQEKWEEQILGTMHEIKLHDEKPIREPPKRVPLHKRQALEEEIKKLEKQNLIV